MIFNITKASDCEYKDTKEFNSIEDIRDFVKKENASRYTPACVLYFNEDKEPELQIYDSWIDRNIFNTMTDEQHNVMWDLYMKGFNHDGHSWNTFTDIEHAVAQILILERNRNDKV